MTDESPTTDTGGGQLEDEPTRAARRPARLELVRTLAAEGIADTTVLAALAAVPRELFVPPELQAEAYNNAALPIGQGQTISQPYVVALMTALARPTRVSRVLEIGTGSGYQTAILAWLAGEVYTIEIVETLAAAARTRFEALGITNVRTRVGDGHDGWPEAAPFDAIVVTAAPPRLPAPLREQLALGGRLVAPVGRDDQELLVVTRTLTGFHEQRDAAVRFVPMIGQAQRT